MGRLCKNPQALGKTVSSIKNSKNRGLTGKKEDGRKPCSLGAQEEGRGGWSQELAGRGVGLVVAGSGKGRGGGWG